jgi:hypothetical protein
MRNGWIDTSGGTYKRWRGSFYPSDIPAKKSASKRWRLLNGSQLMPDVIAGVQFIDGIKHQVTAA